MLVLLADDEPHIICVVARKLQDAGFSVLTANDGEEALELAHQHHPDLIVTDLQMPRMSGLELAFALKGADATASIPIVMLTARGYIVEPADLARTNIKELMAKPFSARDVLSTARRLLDSAEPGRQAA